MSQCQKLPYQAKGTGQKQEGQVLLDQFWNQDFSGPNFHTCKHDSEENDQGQRICVSYSTSDGHSPVKVTSRVKQTSIKSQAEV